MENGQQRCKERILWGEMWRPELKLGTGPGDGGGE